jgi:hypothetical protein
MLVKEFCEFLEEKFNPGMWRAIKVIPADKSPKNKKEQFGEMNNMTKSEIVKSRSHPDIKHLGGKDAVLNYSIYVKHTPLYCIDFDTKDFKTTDLFDSLVNGGCYYSETQKGYHFWVNFENFPGSYQQETNLASEEYFHSENDVDLIKEKRNIWEPHDREVLGSAFGFLDWNDVKKYFKPEKMNFNVPDGVIQGEVVAATVQESDEEIVIDNHQVCDAETMVMYLDRLSQHRVNDYDQWIVISLIIHHNFRDNPIDGYQTFDDWSSKGETYNKKECRKKWDTFKNIDYKRQKATYKKIRKMADEDDPQNEFESIYREKGEEAMVKYMNENLIYKKDSSEFIVIHSELCLDFFIKREQGLKLDYENKGFLIAAPTPKDPHKMKSMNPLSVWRLSKYRREVKRIDFDPSLEAPDNIYNLWVGYYITKEMSKNTGYADNLIEHIKKIWCDNDEITFEYVMNWLAWVIQRPHTKIGVMLALKSKQGAGKGIVLGIIQEIMDGQRKEKGYFAQVANVESILGNFTYGIEGKCLVDFDEAYWGGNKKLEGQVKNLITEPNQEIRKKFAAPYWIKNMTAFIITTNNDLFAGMSEDDRRHMCCQVNDKVILSMSADEKETYFNSLSHSVYGKPAHPEVALSFAHILYNRDISEFNPAKYPKTALAFNQIQHGWGSVTRWWYLVLDEEQWMETNDEYGVERIIYGDMPDEDYAVQINERVYVNKSWMFKIYQKRWMGRYSHKEEKDLFFTKTEDIFGDIWVEKRFQRSDNRTQYIYCPPLNAMRTAFRAHQGYNGKIWSDEGLVTEKI